MQGDVIDTKTATAGNQHCAFVNIVNTLDEGGTAHPGGTTYTTKQDVAVATGVIGVITGGMALAGGTSVTGAIVTVSGIANSIDDIGTNANGESFVQQTFFTESSKNRVGYIKSTISVVNILSDISTVARTSSVVQKIVGVSDIVNIVSATLMSKLNENK